MAETLRDKLKSAYDIDIEIFAKCRNLLADFTFFFEVRYPNFDSQIYDFIRLLGGKKIVNWDQLKEFKKEDYKNVFALGVPDFEYAVEMKTRLSEIRSGDRGVYVEENDEIPVSDWDCVKARELGIKFLNEKEFIDLIVQKGKSYKLQL